MDITVYSKPNCSQCSATYRTMDKKGVEYRSIDMSQDLDALDEVRALGFQQAPVIVVKRDGEVIDSWGGFNAEKIAEFAPQTSELAPA